MKIYNIISYQETEYVLIKTIDIMSPKKTDSVCEKCEFRLRAACDSYGCGDGKIYIKYSFYAKLLRIEKLNSILNENL